MLAGDLLALLRARTIELREVEQLLSQLRAHLNAEPDAEPYRNGEPTPANALAAMPIPERPAWDWDTPPEQLEQFAAEQRKRLAPLVTLLCKRRHELAVMWLEMTDPPSDLAAPVGRQLNAQLEHRRSERDQDVAELREKLSRIRKRQNGPRAQRLRDQITRLEAMTDDELLRTRNG